MAHVDDVVALFQGVEDEFFSVLARHDPDWDSDSAISSIEGLDPAIFEEDNSSTNSDSDAEGTDATERPSQP